MFIYLLLSFVGSVVVESDLYDYCAELDYTRQEVRYHENGCDQYFTY